MTTFNDLSEPTREQIRDLVKDCGLDWHRGFVPLFEGDDTNRYEILVRFALASRDAELAKLRQWRAAVDDMLTTCHMVASDDPRESIDRLINWHVSVHMDPAVSSAAQALVDRGAAQAREPVQPLSNEDIDATWNEREPNLEPRYKVRWFARAIERLITERMSAAKETK